MSDISKDQVVEWLSGQSVIEIADLVKELEEKWGVSAAAPAAVAVAAQLREEMPKEEPQRKKPNLTLFSPNSVAIKLRSSRKSEESRVLASRKPRNWLRGLQKQSKKASPRMRRRKFPRSWKLQEQRLKLSNALSFQTLILLKPYG